MGNSRVSCFFFTYGVLTQDRWKRYSMLQWPMVQHIIALTDRSVRSQPKSGGLVWGSAAAWQCSTFIKWTKCTLAMTLWWWWQHYKYRPGFYYLLLLLLVLSLQLFSKICTFFGTISTTVYLLHQHRPCMKGQHQSKYIVLQPNNSELQNMSTSDNLDFSK